MREPDGTMFIIGALSVCAIVVTIVGIGYEAYLDWYVLED